MRDLTAGAGRARVSGRGDGPLAIGATVLDHSAKPKAEGSAIPLHMHGPGSMARPPSPRLFRRKRGSCMHVHTGRGTLRPLQPLPDGWGVDGRA